jgi:hypothetical protein
MIRFPYRWKPRTVWRNLNYAWGDLVHGVLNLKRWFWAVWWDRDYDWSGLLEFMEKKLRFMIEVHSTEPRHVDWEKTVRNMTICAELCRRLQEGKYFENAARTYGRAFPVQALCGRRFVARHANAVQGYDLYYLGHLLGKHLLCWWD